MKIQNSNKKVEMSFRRTIKQTGILEGVGLHSGEKMKLIFHPAEEGTGLVFVRYKKNNKEYLPVSLENVIDTSLAVTLGKESFHIQTVEHLLYSLFVLGVTDLIMEVEGASEIPIADGSAFHIIETLEELEFHDYPSEVHPIVIQEPVMVTDGDKYLVALPADKFKISYSIDYPHPDLKDMSVQLDFDRDVFKNEIGRARTFGFLKDVEYLKKNGLALGGSTVNALIFAEDGPVNEKRFYNEPLYHKILDLVGDLALVGRPIQGHILGSKGGHALDVAFGKKVLMHDYKYNSFSQKNSIPFSLHNKQENELMIQSLSALVQ